MKNFDLIINHGGAGVVHKCINQHLPQFIIANTMDQPIWLQYVINIKIGNGILNNSNML